MYVPVSVFGKKIPFDSVHEVFEPAGHVGLLVRRLGLNHLVAESLKIVFVQQNQTWKKVKEGGKLSHVVWHNYVGNSKSTIDGGGRRNHHQLFQCNRARNSISRGNWDEMLTQKEISE